HKFLTIDGWARLDTLRRGGFVAAPRRLPAPGEGGATRSSDDRTGRRLACRERGGIATCDLDWDEVVEVTPLGMQPTFDATVAETHNFIADGIVAHNSLEQDADVVIFLYRDEVYNRDTPDRGTAEVIVAKHRNGPIGVTHLAFLDHYTRFANMARV
ncbi:MAG: replicative DNA helicase, partial [Actinomycetota bacterium]|nr:replicative DNA helicase [Actinomycetota bacterium]